MFRENILYKENKNAKKLTMFIRLHSLLERRARNVIHIKHRKYRRFSVI